MVRGPKLPSPLHLLFSASVSWVSGCANAEHSTDLAPWAKELRGADKSLNRTRSEAPIAG